MENFQLTKSENKFDAKALSDPIYASLGIAHLIQKYLAIYL